MNFLNALSTLLFFFPLFGLQADGDGGGAGAAAGGAAGSGGGAAGGSAGNGAAGGQGGAPGGGAGGDGAGAGAGAGSHSQGSAIAGPILGADGKFTRGWTKSLGVDESLEKFTEPKALAGSYAQLQKLINAKGIIKPGDGATKEQLDAYHSALGRPAKPEEYGLDAKPTKITVNGKEVDYDGPWDADFAKSAQSRMFEKGFTKDQVELIKQLDAERTYSAQGNLDKLMADGKSNGEKALREVWGDNYDANLQLAVDAGLKAGMTKEEMQANPHLANDPVFLRVMAKVGDMIVEKPAAGLRGTDSSQRGDPQAEINAIMQNPNHPWHAAAKKTNPAGHAEALKQMTALYERKAAMSGKKGK